MRALICLFCEEIGGYELVLKKLIEQCAQFILNPSGLSQAFTFQFSKISGDFNQNRFGFDVEILQYNPFVP